MAGISFSSLNLNIFTRSVTIHDLKAESPPASAFRYRGTIRRFALSSVDIAAFLRNKEIRIGNVHIDDSRFYADMPPADASLPTGNASGDLKNTAFPVTGIDIGHLTVTHTEFVLKRDTVVEHSGVLNLDVKDVALSDLDEWENPLKYSVGAVEVRIQAYHMDAQSSMYTLDVSQLHVDGDGVRLNAGIDSLVLTPKYTRHDFAQKKGRQIDQFILEIPLISLVGVDYASIADTMLVATHLNIDHPELHVYRDKRLPFIKEHTTPLPVALVRNLPFGFALDSVTITDADITYEEFPEAGFETGSINFDQLNARLPYISNRDHFPGVKQTELSVHSRVMKNGFIDVTFSLPYDKAQVYNAKGKISNLALPSLNPMVESLAFIRIESGHLNALNFDFDYDDVSSRGSMLINYSNVALTGLKKEKNARENDVKSLLLSVLVKKNKTRDVAIERRTGKIAYERDRRRAVFNVWVKSLMSGVKSSVVDAPASRKP